jgi:small redox-active disulfide protein 2
MAQDDVVQIKVEGHGVGIVGLKKVMEEMAGDYAETPDEEVGAELLKRLRRKNYIPDRAAVGYRRAFTREFRKFLGQPYEKDVAGRIDIKVLGRGCPRCDALEHALMEVMAEINMLADMEHIRDIREIGSYGVMGTPALVINGEVKSVGRIPSMTELKEWLHEAKG